MRTHAGKHSTRLSASPTACNGCHPTLFDCQPDEYLVRTTHAVLWHPCAAARGAALLRRPDVWQVPKTAPAVVRLPLRCLLLLLLLLLLLWWRRRRLLPLLLSRLPLRLLLLPLGLRLLRLLRRLPLRLWSEELIDGLLPLRVIFILPDEHLQLHRTACWCKHCTSVKDVSIGLVLCPSSIDARPHRSPVLGLHLTRKLQHARMGHASTR